MAKSAEETSRYLYLNRDGLWTGFHRRALQLHTDGSLELANVPRLAGTLPPDIRTAKVPSTPAGIAVGPDGSVYFTSPDGQSIQRVSGCDAATSCAAVVPHGTLRGLAYSKARRALFAADSGEHCIRVIDPDTGRLLARVGQPKPGADSQASPGSLDQPWCIAVDRSGSLYVIDHGNARLQKWNAVGDIAPVFWENIAASKLIKTPLEVCATQIDGQTRICILDGETLSVVIFDEDGLPVAGADGKPLSLGAGVLQKPMGMTATEDALYVGDNIARRIHVFDLKGARAYVGTAIGYEGPIAALCCDAAELWAYAGTAGSPVTFEVNGGYANSGALWTEQPIMLDHPKVLWQRLAADVGTLPANTHLELFVYTSTDATAGPSSNGGDPLEDPKWRKAAANTADLEDMYIGGDAATYLWLAAQFLSDGGASPVLSQMRVQFDSDSYLDYLPAIYRNETSCAPKDARVRPSSDFLLRFLSLFESVYQDVEGELARLPALFDARATPKQFLAWLADWLGLEVDDSWSDAKQREILQQIFRFYGKRGTPDGIRMALKLFAGLDAVIVEPLLAAEWWSLPSAQDACCQECTEDAVSGSSWESTGSSVLGFTTMLAAAQPQGAVVGTSAVLDQSHLLMANEFGAPLFRDVAYQFCVQLYRGQLICPQALPRARAVLAQEMPAHTAYTISIVEPRMRVGYQSRVGMDTVVGGVSGGFTLGSEQGLGSETALAGPVSTRLGQSRLGFSTHVG